jgi:hypothetical protein
MRRARSRATLARRIAQRCSAGLCVLCLYIDDGHYASAGVPIDVVIREVHSVPFRAQPCGVACSAHRHGLRHTASCFVQPRHATWRYDGTPRGAVRGPIAPTDWQGPHCALRAEPAVLSTHESPLPLSTPTLTDRQGPHCAMAAVPCERRNQVLTFSEIGAAVQWLERIPRAAPTTYVLLQRSQAC